MQIRLGYQLIYNFPQPTPMILTLNIHYSRTSDLIIPDYLTTDPPIPIAGIVMVSATGAPERWRLAAASESKPTRSSATMANRTGSVLAAQQHGVPDLPEETLVFLVRSRYCETDLLSQVAWVWAIGTGWARVQAICDYVHNQIAFNYHHSRATRTAWEAFNECTGVAATTPILPLHFAAA